MDGKLRFDPVVGLGHIMQIIAAALFVGIGWVNLDKRVIVLEQQTLHQGLRDRHQDEVLAVQSKQIKESLNEVKAYLLRLDTRLETMQKAQNENTIRANSR